MALEYFSGLDKLLNRKRLGTDLKKCIDLHIFNIVSFHIYFLTHTVSPFHSCGQWISMTLSTSCFLSWELGCSNTRSCIKSLFSESLQQSSTERPLWIWCTYQQVTEHIKTTHTCCWISWAQYVAALGSGGFTTSKHRHLFWCLVVIREEKWPR